MNRTQTNKLRHEQIRVAAERVTRAQRKPGDIMAMAFALQDRFQELSYETACDYIFKAKNRVRG